MAKSEYQIILNTSGGCRQCAFFLKSTGLCELDRHKQWASIADCSEGNFTLNHVLTDQPVDPTKLNRLINK